MYKIFDIVKVPFPFSDFLSEYKVRPALVISSYWLFWSKINHSVLLMITSADHSHFPFDTKISNYNWTWLPKECIVRMKFFTIDNNIIISKIWTLHCNDIFTVKNNLNTLFWNE